MSDFEGDALITKDVVKQFLHIRRKVDPSDRIGMQSKAIERGYNALAIVIMDSLSHWQAHSAYDDLVMNIDQYKQKYNVR